MGNEMGGWEWGMRWEVGRGDEGGGWEGRGGGRESQGKQLCSLAKQLKFPGVLPSIFRKLLKESVLKMRGAVQLNGWQCTLYKYRLENIHNVALAEKVFIFLFK